MENIFWWVSASGDVVLNGRSIRCKQKDSLEWLEYVMMAVNNWGGSILNHHGVYTFKWGVISFRKNEKIKHEAIAYNKTQKHIVGR